MIRVGIVGCGKITQVRHLPEYLANPQVEIAGYYDLTAERAQQLADRYGGRVYQSMEEMFQDPAIDAVSICIANKYHASATIAALNAGKHVLCEKPMATNIEDCEAMVEAADRNHRKLMIDQNQRLIRTHQRARQLIHDGFIGRVITFRTTFGHKGPETWSINPGKATWFFDRSQSGMGAIADLGIHKMDLIQYILGEEIVETTSKVVTLNKRDASGSLIGVDDNAICILRTQSGAVGTLTASWTYYGEEENFTILYGEKGIMKIFDDPLYSIKVLTSEGDEIGFKIDDIQTNDRQTSTGVIDAFVDSIVNDTVPAIDGRSVLSAMRAVFASIESSETGLTVRVNGAGAALSSHNIAASAKG